MPYRPSARAYRVLVKIQRLRTDPDTGFQPSHNQLTNEAILGYFERELAAPEAAKEEKTKNRRAEKKAGAAR